MVCDRVLRNVDPSNPLALADKRPDFVDLHWHEAGLRALRKSTRAGRLLRILLPLGVALRHGDVLMEDATSLVIVAVVPAEVLVITPRTLAEMATIALEIGNLHAPAQVSDAGELLVIPDGPVEAILWRLGFPHTLQMRRFTPLAVEALPTVGLASDFGISGDGSSRPPTGRVASPASSAVPPPAPSAV